MLQLGIDAYKIQDSKFNGSGHSLNSDSSEKSTSSHNTPRCRPAFENPGEGLSPDSDIWKKYVQEANEFDNNLTIGRDKNLDTMLVFAGLYSAILTAFLIESTDMLEPDLAETSTAILLSIAQSQWRIETGNSNKSVPMVDLPAFEPTASARWINTLWFMALVLSLGAAMLAMIAKEWLAAFRAWPPRHPLEYSLKRQARLDGLELWRATHIIDLLPTFLHLSLVLFSCGLIIKIWLLDPVIATIVGAVSGIITFAYAATIFCAAVSKNCPYRTRVSYHFKKFLKWFISLFKRKKDPAAEPQAKLIPDLSDRNKATMSRSLEWLAENARDPDIGNSAWEALTVSVLGTVRARQRKNASDREQRLGPNEKHLEISHLLNSLKSYVRRLGFCGSLRAAATLPEIYYYISHVLSQSRPSHAKKTVANLCAKLRDQAAKIEDEACRVFDAIWETDELLLADPNKQAALAASELRLTKFLAKKALDGQKVSQTHRPHTAAQPMAESGSGVSTPSNSTAPAKFGTNCSRASKSHRAAWPNNVHTPGSHITVDFGTASGTGLNSASTLDALEARSGRTLKRAAQLLSYSSGRQPTGMSTDSLVNLLEAICDVARVDEPCTPETASIHNPQEGGCTSSSAVPKSIGSPKNTSASNPQENNGSPGSAAPPEPENTKTSKAVNAPNPPEHNSTSSPTTSSSESPVKYLISAPDDIGAAHGLLATLTTFIGNASMMELPKLEVASLNAMAAIGLELRKQWVQKQMPPTQEMEDAAEYLDGLNWSDFSSDSPNHFPQIATNVSGAIACLLDIAHFSIFFIHHDGVCQLSDLALQSLYNRASAPSTQYIAHEAIRPRIGMIEFWVNSVGSVKLESRREKSWRQRAKLHLVRLLVIQDEKGQSILHHLLMHMWGDADCYRVLPTLLQLIVIASGHPKDIQELLETIVYHVRDARNGSCYFKAFSADRGFQYLRHIGLNPNFAALVSRNIRDIVTYLVNMNTSANTAVPIESEATSGLLDAITFVCENMPAQWDKSVDSFATSAITLLQRSQFSSQLLTRELEALGDLQAASTQMRNEAAKTGFLSIHDSLKAKLEKLKDAELTGPSNEHHKSAEV